MLRLHGGRGMQHSVHHARPTIGGLLREAHHRVEAKEQARVSQAEMAHRLGISPRTYAEYLRGTNAPLGMGAVLRLLAQLPDKEMVVVVRAWAQQDDVASEGELNA